MQEPCKKTLTTLAIIAITGYANMMNAATVTRYPEPQGESFISDFLLPAIGFRCDGAGFEHGHGYRTRNFTGTVMGRYAKRKKRPVEGVRFYDFWSLDPELSFTTNAKGRFEGDLSMHFEKWKKCIDGMVVGGSSIRPMEVTLRAKGCRELKVTFVAEKSKLAIELNCTKSIP